MFLLDAPVSVAYGLVTGLADVLHPVAGGLAASAAIVVFTAAVRLLLIPLAIAQARGERTRARLLPQIQTLQKKHAKNPQRLQREMAELYADEGGSLLAGCLPMLVQMPFFASRTGFSSPRPWPGTRTSCSRTPCWGHR